MEAARGSKAKVTFADGQAPEPATLAAPAEAPAELSNEQLAKMTKEERKAYHMARRSAQIVATAAAPKAAAAPLTKAQRRALQEAQRKVKDDKKETAEEEEEILKEMMLGGLSKEDARALWSMSKEQQVQDEEDDDGPDDLLASVRKWMDEQPSGKVPDDSYQDFLMKVRFQGHVDTTPPDHINAILRVLVQQACSGVRLEEAKLQPAAVAKKVEPVAVRWAPLLEPLYSKIDDVLVGVDEVLRGVREGIADIVEGQQGGAGPAAPEAQQNGTATAMVGSLMALREIDMIEDEDLLTGCRRFEPRSRVLDKFIEFLEEELDDEDGDEDGDDE